MDRPGARISARIDSVEREARGLVEEEQRGLENAVGEERQQLSVLGENELSGGRGRAALRAVLRQNRLHRVLEVAPHVRKPRGVQLQRGGARQGEHHGHAVEAFEETRVGGGGLQTLVENAQTTLSGIRRVGGVKEPRGGERGGDDNNMGIITIMGTTTIGTTTIWG